MGRFGLGVGLLLLSDGSIGVYMGGWLEDLAMVQVYRLVAHASFPCSVMNARGRVYAHTSAVRHASIAFRAVYWLARS